MGNDQLLNHSSIISNSADEDKDESLNESKIDYNFLVSSSKDLKELVGVIIKYNSLNELSFNSNYSLYDGRINSDLMIVGDFPSKEDLEIGLPFQGEIGELLDAMLKAIDFDRKNTYFTNLFYNEDKKNDNLEFYLSVLHKQIELVNPRVVILLGEDVTKIVLKKNESIFSLRGKWFDLNSSLSDSIFSAISIFHPRHLYIKPENKKEAWIDLKEVRKKFS